MKIVLTDTDYPDVVLEQSLCKEADITLSVAQCRTPQEVIEAAQGASALLVQYAPITREVFEALPELGIVSRYGVGVDTIDLEAAKERGVWVANVPDYGVEEVAAHAFGMALALVRHLPFYDRDIRQGSWHFESPGTLHRLSTLTFGVLGMGRIGRTVATRAQAWFGQVVGYDAYLNANAEVWPQGVRQVEVEALFKESDVLSLHAPLTHETQGIVNSERLSVMKPGSYLINTARGGLVDIRALRAALGDGQLAGAGLDVLPQEPPDADDPLVHHPRVLLSPHAAFYSREAAQELRRKTVQNVITWVQEGTPLYPVVTGSKTAA